jgi:hypothetical protein
VEEDQAAHRRDRHRPRERHAEKARAEVDLAHVDEDVLLDGEAVQMAAVAAAGRLRLRPAGAEVPDRAGEAPPGGLADLAERDEARGSGWFDHEVVL